MPAIVYVGWQPTMPVTWYTHDSNICIKFNHDPGQSHHRVLYKLRHEMERQLWAQAAVRYGGDGLQNGIPDLRPAKAAKKQLVRRGLFAEAAAVDRVAAGATWTGEMLKKTYDELAVKDGTDLIGFLTRVRRNWRACLTAAPRSSHAERVVML